ncbi:MAG: hypothetical protein J0H53_05160 [Rhizobiales bacterium]|nr:hypothetical protein [Hyphomicrobiales bacterium]
MTAITSQMRLRARRRMLAEHYPHRVGLPETFCTYENFTALNDFCRERFGEYPKTESIYGAWEGFSDGQEMRLYCFPTPEQAAEFCAYFDGLPFDERSCKKNGKDRRIWILPGLPAHRIQHGPLSVPRWLRENP